MLRLFAVIFVALQCAQGAPINQPAVTSPLDPWTYLTRFGYIPKEVPRRSHDSTLILEDALKRFQRFVGLEVTGVVDEPTLVMMRAERCGVSDNGGLILSPNMRYILQGSKWDHKDITWRLGQSTAQDISRARVEEEIIKAFQLWADVADLTFTQAPSDTTTDVDIDILFAAYWHGDGEPFDGPGGILAHAAYPGFGGDAHMDESETWSADHSTTTKHLLQTFAHEFGHSLGLMHTDKRDSLMMSHYRRWLTVVALGADDIAGIQAIYGPKADS